MTHLRIATLAAAAAFALTPIAIAADEPRQGPPTQTAQAAPQQQPQGQEHDTHHPAQPPSAPQQMGPGAQGMMGQGMMGQGMMGDGMGRMMQMMGMHGQAGPGMGGMGGMDMMGMHERMMTERVEGRIAFLRAELKITNAQARAWDQFAEALRAGAKKIADARPSAAQAGATPPTLSQRLEQRERALAARLDGARAIKAALDPLFAALSEDQKKTADQLLPVHVGLMPMGMM